MAEKDGDSRDEDWQRTLAQRERDLAEMQNEIGGRGHSRIRRFLPEDHESNPEAQAKRKQKERAYRSALRALLKNDAAYRALYEETFDKLRTHEAATERALDQAREDLAEAKDALDEMRENASTLQDGTRVYRSEDGSFYSEDGTLITGEALESIEWREGASSYEDYLAQKKATADAEGRMNDLLVYQADVLGDIRNRMEDEDNPPSKEDMEMFQEKMEHAMRNRAEHQPEPVQEVPATTASTTAGMQLPPVGR